MSWVYPNCWLSLSFGYTLDVWDTSIKGLWVPWHVVWLIRCEELVWLRRCRVLKFQAWFTFWNTEEVMCWVPETETDSLFYASEDFSSHSVRMISENVSSILLHRSVLQSAVASVAWWIELLSVGWAIFIVKRVSWVHDESQLIIWELAHFKVVKVQNVLECFSSIIVQKAVDDDLATWNFNTRA